MMMMKDFARQESLAAVRCGDYAANQFWMAVIAASRTLEVTDSSIEQGNPAYDPDYAANGGGYDQPVYRAVVNGTEVIVNDASCGDFGSRFFVSVGDEHAQFGSMEPDMEGSGLSFESLALLWIAGECGAVRTFSNSRWEWLVSEAWDEHLRKEAV